MPGDKVIDDIAGAEQQIRNTWLADDSNFFVPMPSSPKALSAQPQNQQSTSSNNESLCEAKIRSLIAASIASSAYHISDLLKENSPLIKALSIAGMMIAGGIAFSPEGSKKEKAVKTLICAAAVALCTFAAHKYLPEKNHNERLSIAVITGMINCIGLLVLWHMAEGKSSYSQKQRSLGIIVAAFSSRVSEFLFSGNLKSVFGITGIAAGMLCAFPPYWDSLGIKIALLVPGNALFNTFISQYEIAPVIATVTNAIMLAAIWYPGRCRLMNIGPQRQPQ